MPYIEVIGESQAEGRLKEIYQDLLRSRGKIAEVHTIQSLNPESIIHHMDLYMGIMFGKSPLRRAQREMIATVVSAANECAYCVTHHATALDHFWKDAKRLEQFTTNFRSAGLAEADLLLCEYADQLTREPGKDHEDKTTQMKGAGLTDRAILDAALVISYFNFVNRMVLGLGVKLEEDGGKGFKYD